MEWYCKQSYPEFHFVHNNGVVAVWPNPDGPLGMMAEIDDRGRARCWVFSDPHICEGRVDTEDLRAFHGNLNEWHEFRTWLESNGYTITRGSGGGSGYVPFSNGKRNFFCDAEDRPQQTYLDSEWQYRRCDSPRMAIKAYASIAPVFVPA
ncbi:MAG: hypothetical protein WCT24_03695 [Patescibacteria group bacterium]|jgi:hypothetical protein